jgi:diguanylate cyclase (GGDEF)-like protein/PAS domain S-box-containing protein
MFIMDGDGTILEANAAAAELISLPLENLRGTPLHTLFNDSADAVLLREQLDARRLFHEIEVRLRRRDGTDRWCLISAAARSDEQGRILGYQAIARDVTDRKRAEERLLHRAFHDPLTDLPNRALFMDRLRLALARCKRQSSRRCAVLFLDLDRFKSINDSYGHTVGDELLVRVAHSLAAAVRSDDTVARIGGDEFAILLETVDTDLYPGRAADRILQTLQQPFQIEGRRVHTSASIGIAFPESLEQPPSDILRNADIAMYRAKAKGMACYAVFMPGDDRTIDPDLEAELRLAVQGGELLLHYQPVIEERTGHVAGMEALLRWQHPRRGLLGPAEFLDLAERSGLIFEIGWWVLHEACSRARRLFAEIGPALVPYVGVNLSASQLALTNLQEQVVAILESTGLPPQQLVIEVRENALITGFQTTVTNLRRLRETGVRVCVDNVSTPQRSAAWMQIFQVDAIKLDPAFTARLADDPDGTALMHTIVEQATRLNIATIATGIETDEQHAVAREAGALFMQGLLFSPPVDPAAAGALMMRSWATPADPVSAD